MTWSSVRLGMGHNAPFSLDENHITVKEEINVLHLSG